MTPFGVPDSYNKIRGLDHYVAEIIITLYFRKFRMNIIGYMVAEEKLI